MYPRNYAEACGSPSPSDGKTLGAYYTDDEIADFLAWWAIRSSTDTVLDPCFGGGVFLRAACSRLAKLGGRPGELVTGVEIDATVHQSIAAKLVREFSLSPDRLLLADFFSLSPGAMARADVVIGNPPFVRYQRFTGNARSSALSRSAEQGVRLPELCSSWAPFLIHSIAMLRPGGRLAMVLPMEIGHAKYARPVLEHIRQSFGSVTFLTFEKKLFPELSQDTILLLACDKGVASSEFLWRDLAGPSLLRELRQVGRWPLGGTRKLNSHEIASGDGRLVEHFIPPEARKLYRALRQSPLTQRLGDLTDVGIGYVTGANDFFHLDPAQVRDRSIPSDCLKPVVRRGRALSGLRFSRLDWESASKSGQAGYLLHIGARRRIPDSVRHYLRHGETEGIPNAYKCRMRSPWYSVPHVHRPDAFLTYMSGTMPRLVANDAGVYAPNTLHVLRLHPLVQITSDVLAALWLTSITRLSVEIEGHAMGGGMLKLEPKEAESVILPSLHRSSFQKVAGLAGELDPLIREQGVEAATERADHAILVDILGLGRRECDLLRSAADRLRDRRLDRGAENEPS